MKHLIFIFLTFLSVLPTIAQDNGIEWYTFQSNAAMEFSNSYKKLALEDTYAIKITGEISYSDLRALFILSANNALRFVDISETTVVGDKFSAGQPGHFPSASFSNEGGFNSSKLEYINLPNTITSIGELAFKNCTELATVIVHESVTKIGKQCFQGCTSLETIELPNSITVIEYGIFTDSGLVTFSVPSGLKTLTQGTFSYCNKLKSLYLGDNITKIEYNAVRDCPQLVELTIGANTSYIDSYFVSGNSSLVKITCLNPTPPTCYVSQYSNPFTDFDCSKCSLYVPAESVESYRKASCWSKFGSILPIEGAGINAVESDSDFEINSHGIFCSDKCHIKVFDVNGREIFNGITNEVHLPLKGLFIISINGKVSKHVL